MKKNIFLALACVFAITGIVALFVKKSTTSTATYRQEVPERPSGRNPASEIDPATSSKPSGLSVRPAEGATAGLNITESQITLMEQNITTLQKDVSVFKDTNAWVIRFHHSNKLMSALGVKDNDQITFKHLDDMKNEPALEALTKRLENIFLQLQK